MLIVPFTKSSQFKNKGVITVKWVINPDMISRHHLLSLFNGPHYHSISMPRPIIGHRAGIKNSFWRWRQYETSPLQIVQLLKHYYVAIRPITYKINYAKDKLKNMQW